MTAIILDGKGLSLRIRNELKERVERMAQRGVVPRLATIQVGDDKATRIYLGAKEKAAKEVGIQVNGLVLEDSTTESVLHSLIHRLNNDEATNGILLQFPLPKHLGAEACADEISPEKDVDGQTSFSRGRITSEGSFVPCTPKGIMTLLREYAIPIRGKHVVIVGRSNLVGKPLALLMLQEDATVTICHSKTANIPEISRQADILVSAVGRRDRFAVTPDMVKKESVVIDVGITRMDGKVVGDVDGLVAEKCSFISPVPGGVGPMTVAMLLENVLQATENQEKRS